MLRSILLCVSLLVMACGSPVVPTRPASGQPPTTSPVATSPAGTPEPAASPEPATPEPATPAPTAAPSAAQSAMPSPSATPTSASTTRPARWVKAGRFTEPRQDTQLALLGNGQVLAAGDEPTCGIESSASDTSEIWRPRTSRWRRTDRLPSGRTKTTLIPLADGRAMVTGGATQQYVAKSGTAVYDPATRRWKVSGLLNTARMEFAAAALPDGGALVAGGLVINRQQDGRALRSAERWDPATGAWSEIEPLASVRQHAVAETLADGRVLVVGGYPEWGGDPVATAEIYNPRTGHWQGAGRLSTARDGFTLVALPDGGALVLGGNRNEDWAERFDPDTRTWARVPGRSPAGERPAAAVLASGLVLVVSGGSAKLWNPAAGRWSRTAPLPGGMWDASAVVLGDGSVLVGGGWTEAPPEGDTGGCESYSSQTWRYIPGT